MKSRGEKGSAIVTVLWVLALLSLSAAAFSFSARIGLLTAYNLTQGIKARAIAEGGVEAAISELLGDLDTKVDTLKEDWHGAEESFREIELGEGYFSVVYDNLENDSQASYGVVDEASKINVNTAGREILANLPGMSLGLADCILDWVDLDSFAREAGAEDGYYGTLADPYQARNAKCVTVRELLLVKGIGEQILYGEDTNGNGVLDPNENDGETSLPSDNADGKLDRGLMPYVTVYSYDFNKDKNGNKRLNLNSAGEKEIKEKLKVNDEEAKQIIKYRDQLAGKKFASLGDLLDIKKEEGQGKSSKDRSSEEEKDYLISDEKFSKIADLVTLTNDSKIEGLINVNTASQAVLEAFPEIDSALAEDIIEYRESTTGPFDTVGELIKVEAMTRKALKGIIDMVTVRSHNFRIVSRGIIEQPRTVVQVEAIVERANEKTLVRYWKQIY